MGMRKLWGLGLLLALMFAPGSANAATYYVDYTNGLDTNNGTSKATPWKRAPGMYGATGNVASTHINAGDSIILKGCVSWPNDNFAWWPTATQFSNGTTGSPIYVGVDKTWWDATVSGCSSAWNRPILDLQGKTTDSHGSNLSYVIDSKRVSYITWDNFEIINWYTYPNSTSGSNNAVVFDVGHGDGATNITVQNMYVHHWINPFISIGTGDITSGSCTVENYAPYAYSPSPSSSWLNAPGHLQVQSLPQGTNIPIGNGSPTVTAVTGSNPYTITFTNTAGCATHTVTGTVIQIGMDVGRIVMGNGDPVVGDPGTVIQNNVFDGSDTAEVQWNPTGDCGASTGNNNACLASVLAGKMGPQIWRNNVIRYVSNGFIGFSSEMSGNLIEYIRLSTDPTEHTNVWEELPALGNTNLYFNNVIRHMNSVNTNIPGGRWEVGVPLMIAPPSAEATAYVFNNVMYDLIPNISIEINGAHLLGAAYVFNNTVQTGPTYNVNYPGFSCTTATCVVQNNLWVTSNSTPGGKCGTGCTSRTNLAMTPIAATAAGYTTSQPYALFPTLATSPTVGVGTSIASICAQLTGAAATACASDTSYAVGYDTTRHTVTSPNRTVNARQTTPDIGAYQFTIDAVPAAPADVVIR
jgi:hypothetical protein